jgi:hypothetical protein
MIKKSILFGISLFSALSFAQNKTVNLNIHHTIDGITPYGVDSVLYNNQSQPCKISFLQYYLGDIDIITTTNDTISLDTVFLVKPSSPELFNLGEFDIPGVSKIEFGIGVEEKLNHLDPTLYSSGSALAPQNPSMHWGWSAGYRFVVFEGDVAAGLTQSLEIHALGDTNYYKQSHDNSGMINGDTINLTFIADYSKALNKIDLNGGIVHHGAFLPSCIEIMKNFRDHVFLPTLHLDVTDEIAHQQIQLFPNPTTDFVQFSQELENISIYSALGKKEKEFMGKFTSIDIHDLPNGIYYIQGTSNGNIHKLKVVKQ